MSDLQTAIDGIAGTRREARTNAKQVMARHLRREHAWGIRRIGRELGMTDKEVREATA